MKSIFFLGGLPRSGNTLLSALLNQHPSIYVSPLSPLLNVLLNMDANQNIMEETQSADFTNNTTKALQNYVTGFYQHINKPVIIDRQKSWGSKESVYMAYKYITDKPKIIFTVRDIPSILTSFLSLATANFDNFIDVGLNRHNYKSYGKQTHNDLRCDWLMNNQIGTCLTALTEALQINANICLIEYDELIQNPQFQLDKIYTFLELDPFVNDLCNIQKLETETLAAIGLPDNLHDVRPKISINNNKSDIVLDPITLQKYSGLEFWRT